MQTEGFYSLTGDEKDLRISCIFLMLTLFSPLHLLTFSSPSMQHRPMGVLLSQGADGMLCPQVEDAFPLGK